MSRRCQCVHSSCHRCVVSLWWMFLVVIVTKSQTWSPVVLCWSNLVSVVDFLPVQLRIMMLHFCPCHPNIPLAVNLCCWDFEYFGHEEELYCTSKLLELFKTNTRYIDIVDTFFMKVISLYTILTAPVSPCRTNPGNLNLSGIIDHSSVCWSSHGWRWRSVIEWELDCSRKRSGSSGSILCYY